MSRKQIFETVLFVLSVILVAAKTIDEVAKLPELSDDGGPEI